MSDNDFDFDDNETQAPKPAGKSLREQLEAVLAKNRELEEKLAKESKANRATSLTSILGELKVNPKIAKYVPTEIGADKAAIEKWLNDEGDAFGYTKPAEKTQEVETVPTNENRPNPDAELAQLQAAFERLQNPDATGATGSLGRDAAALAQMHALAEKANGNFERLVELQTQFIMNG